MDTDAWIKGDTARWLRRHTLETARDYWREHRRLGDGFHRRVAHQLLDLAHQYRQRERIA